MKAIGITGWIVVTGVLVLLGAGWLILGAGAEPVEIKSVDSVVEPLHMSEEEWRERLTPQQFSVLREEATERAGTSPLNREKRDGVFVCAGCGLPLFRSETKFESGTGWPSFYDAIEGHVATRTDYRLLIPRTEYHCARCGGHQGHVFKDGPAPTGLRYCNNGVALTFVPSSEDQP